jgi:hypothetical protein
LFSEQVVIHVKSDGVRKRVGKYRQYINIEI